MSNYSVVIKKGTKIVCPLCDTEIGEVAKNINYGEILSSKNLTIYEAELKDRQLMLCPKCGFPYCVELDIGAVISTEHGWLPIKIPRVTLLPYIVCYLKRKNLWKKEWGIYFEDQKK